MRLLYRLKTKVDLLLTKIKELVHSIVFKHESLNNDSTTQTPTYSNDYDEEWTESRDDDVIIENYENTIANDTQEPQIDESILTSEEQLCDSNNDTITENNFSHDDSDDSHCYINESQCENRGSNSSTSDPDFEKFKKWYYRRKGRNMYEHCLTNKPPKGKSDEVKIAYVWYEFHEAEYRFWFCETGFKIDPIYWRNTNTLHRVRVCEPSFKSQYEIYRNACKNTRKSVLNKNSIYKMYFYDESDYCDIYNYKKQGIATYTNYLNVSNEERLKFLSDINLGEFVGNGVDILQFILSWHMKTEYVVLDQNNNPVLAA